jgi:hypothetical protein
MNPLDPLFSGQSEVARRMRDVDWAKTPLGPVENWPQSLKTSVRIMLTSRQPMFVWGDELINLYNDAYKSIVGASTRKRWASPPRSCGMKSGTKSLHARSRLCVRMKGLTTKRCS